MVNLEIKQKHFLPNFEGKKKNVFMVNFDSETCVFKVNLKVIQVLFRISFEGESKSFFGIKYEDKKN